MKWLIILMLVSCVASPAKRVWEVTDAARMPFTVDNKADFIGVGTLQRRTSYVITFKPRYKPFDFKLWTCAGEEFFEKIGDTIQFTFSPVFDIENSGFCPIQAWSISKSGIEEYAIVSFNNGYKLQTKVRCNRRTIDARGHYVCQMPAGLIGGLVGREPLDVEPMEGCERPTKKSPYRWEFTVEPGWCTFAVMGLQSKEFFILATKGYVKND